ncbi:MAG: T9SS type A sorting domain-containing protein [Saprospiraceae bacterium]
MNLMIYTMAAWFSITGAITTNPEMLHANRETRQFFAYTPKGQMNNTPVPESMVIRASSYMADTCYVVGIADSIFLFPDAPVVTLTPEAICSPSIITIHINGRLRNKGAKWVIYTSGCGAGSPLGSTRGNSFVDASLSSPSYYVREETCLIGEFSLNIKGACGTASVGFNIADTDGDGTNDCVDGCPLDALKITPGACGCGIPDLDSDLDGTPDCIDTDNDNDNIDDNIDNCPLEYNPHQKDIDLDGLGDVCDPIVNLGGVVENAKDIIAADITNRPLRQSLVNTLNIALSLYCHGRPLLALNTLLAFNIEVLVNRGKKIPVQTANNLINLSQAMMASILNHTAQCPSSDLSILNPITNSRPSTSALYPNPASQQTWLDLSHFQQGDLIIQLSDIKGAVLRTWHSDLSNNGKMNLNLYGLSPGLYIIRTHSGPESETFKLIIQ